MNIRRQLLLAAAALSLGTASVHAQDNVLRVGTDATFPPMEYVDNGKRTGFDIELVEALAKAMGKQVEWVDIDFKGLIPGLISKRFDMAVSAIYITDERKKVVDFTVQLAVDHKKGIDIHLHETGDSGLKTVEYLIKKVNENPSPGLKALMELEQQVVQEQQVHQQQVHLLECYQKDGNLMKVVL